MHFQDLLLEGTGYGGCQDEHLHFQLYHYTTGCDLAWKDAAQWPFVTWICLGHISGTVLFPSAFLKSLQSDMDLLPTKDSLLSMVHFACHLSVLLTDVFEHNRGDLYEGELLLSYIQRQKECILVLPANSQCLFFPPPLSCKNSHPLELRMFGS